MGRVTPNPNPHQHPSQAQSLIARKQGGERVRTSPPTPLSVYSEGEQEKTEDGPPLEIDTAGLIADLMGNPLPDPPPQAGEGEEKKAESIDQPAKTRKRRGKKAAD